jgi:hypothetical protein
MSARVSRHLLSGIFICFAARFTAEYRVLKTPEIPAFASGLKNTTGGAVADTYGVFADTYGVRGHEKDSIGVHTRTLMESAARFAL